jgi:hypothetical protein
MADIRLINILPPSNVTQTPSISQGTSGSPGVIVQFPVGSILSGFILNRDNRGNPILRTEFGDITFQTDLFLKIGSEVVIKVINRGGATLAQILSINGQAPETASPAQPIFPGKVDSATPQSPSSYTLSATTPQSLPVSPATQSPISIAPTTSSLPTITGIILTPPVSPDASPPSPLSLKIVSVLTPSGSPAETPQPVAQSPASYNAYTRVTETQTSIPATQTALTPPPSITPSALPITPPAQPTATPSFSPLPTGSTPQPLTAGQVITVPVIAQEPTGEALLQTPAGIVRLQETTLPIGSKVTLEVLPPSTPAAATAPPTASLLPAPLPELAGQWVSLQQIASLLASRPNATSLPWQPTTNASQNPAPELTAKNISTGLLLFIAALRGGDFRNWLGDDNVRWLQQTGHEPLVRKAEAEFVTLARTFTETPPAQQWQALFFPVAVEGQHQQVRMFLKRDRKSDKKPGEKNNDGTRFIVEISLSQMGEMQLDGFVRREPVQVEFDLFIRSLSPIEEAIQRDIQRIYGDIGQITGYRGSVVFQAVREFPVNPMEEILQSPLGGVLA